MIRTLDFVLSLIGLLLLWPIMIMITVIGYFDLQKPIFRQVRVGRNRQEFTLIKFRTMPLDTASKATHLIDDVKISRYGRVLRSSKLDELPQLINVLKGEMSLVGPRPCLPNQSELIFERDKRSVFAARPGITGLGQIENVDMSTPCKLAELDRKMLEELNVGQYFGYIFKTLLGSGAGDSLKR